VVTFILDAIGNTVMAGNIATLVPITKGDPRGGRRKGQVNLTTKV
jgi:hypothetical protein